MSSFEVIRPAMEYFLGWNGPIGDDLRRRGRTLEFRARNSTGVRTGRLRADIKTRERAVVDGLQVEVGNWGVRYAAAHHQGAKPHKIRARNAPFLHFYWEKHGTWVKTQEVNHPGNRPNPYLARWLREAVR